MAEFDNPTNSDDNDHLDLELDAVLARYSAVEPRSGIESRILSHLRSTPAPSASRHWWGWGFAGAAAIVIVIAFVWRGTRPSHLVIANHPPTAILQPTLHPTPAQKTPDREARNPGTQNDEAHSSSGAKAELAAATRARARKPSLPRAAAVATYPKLDHFPSPEPLSPEEAALARYVSQFPKEAVLIARTQQASEQELDQKKRGAGWDIPLLDSSPEQTQER
ncbi:MAG TPA: hypothetical protein VMG31_10800 [Verrucomicrobiae bacterium]|nr:hypothetical protein [Verrucomicrobiae bacterium]